MGRRAISRSPGIKASLSSPTERITLPTGAPRDFPQVSAGQQLLLTANSTDPIGPDLRVQTFGFARFAGLDDGRWEETGRLASAGRSVFFSAGAPLLSLA